MFPLWCVVWPVLAILVMYSTSQFSLSWKFSSRQISIRWSGILLKIDNLPDHNFWLHAAQDYLYLLYYWIQAQLFSSISDSSNVGRNQMDRTGLSYKEQEQGSSLIEKGYDFYKDIQFIEGQPNKKSGLNSSKIKMISEWVSPVIKH